MSLSVYIYTYSVVVRLTPLEWHVAQLVQLSSMNPAVSGSLTSECHSDWISVMSW